MFIIEDDRCCNNSTSPLFYSEDTEQPFYEKPSKDKDRSPFTLLTTSKFVKNRFLNSLTLPSKKLRSSSDPKGGKPLFENKLGLRRNRTVTEPCSNSDFSPGDGFGPIFNVPKIHTLRLANSYVGSKNIDDTGSTPSIGENDLKLPKIYGIENHRENSSRERLLGDISTGTNFKSRSLSFNTDTTTSGISSMSSSPSRETIDTANIDTDCGSLSTVVSTNTVKTKHPSVPHSNHLPISKSNSVSLVPPGSFHTLPRRAQSLKAPSIAAIKSLAEYNICYTSSRDAFGYATLKRLQQQRMHPSLSHSEALASPAKDVLFTDTITMKTGSLDSRLTPNRFTRALSYASLDKEDLLSPINQNTLHRSSSVRSMVSNATYGCSDDYIGLALPMDVNEIFQVKDIPYFQKKTIPPSDRAARISFPENGDVKNPFQALRQQISLSEILNSCDSEASQCLDNPEDTGLPEHTDNNCLYCLGMLLLGCHNQANSAFTLADLPDIPLSDWCGLAICNHLEVVSHSSKYSGISGCSDAVSQSSTSSTKSTELVIGKFTGGKTIPEDAPVRRIKVRKEILRLVINLSSSVGTKGHETGLLTIKEKFPHVFDDICLFSEISYLLAQCTFRLSSRRFIHELFQDIYFQRIEEAVKYEVNSTGRHSSIAVESVLEVSHKSRVSQMHEVAAIVLAKPPKPTISEPPAES